MRTAKGGNLLLHHGFVSEQSRKAKATRSLYDYLRTKIPSHNWESNFQWENIEAAEGIPVPANDKTKVLNIRFHDEQYSPHFKTDMSLFHMMMMDANVEVKLFRAERGWLFVFEGLPVGPKPFGQNGFDTR